MRNLLVCPLEPISFKHIFRAFSINPSSKLFTMFKEFFVIACRQSRKESVNSFIYSSKTYEITMTTTKWWSRLRYHKWKILFFHCFLNQTPKIEKKLCECPVCNVYDDSVLSLLFLLSNETETIIIREAPFKVNSSIQFTRKFQAKK